MAKLLSKLFGGEEKKGVFKKEAKAEQKIVVQPKALEEKKEVLSALLVPHITEKATMAEALGQYVFRVDSRINKIDVAREISKLYKVKVVSVRMASVPGKKRRVGGKIGFRSGYKKAIVKLAKGQTIELK